MNINGIISRFLMWIMWVNRFFLIWLAFGETYPYLGKFHHDRTLFSRTLESWLVRGIIPKLPYFSLVNYYNSRSLRDENRPHQV